MRSTSNAPRRWAVLSPSAPFDRLQMTIAPSSIRRREVIDAARLGEHVAQARRHQRLADLVLDRGDRLAPKALLIAGILVEPERAHHGIAHVAADEPHAQRLVDQQAGEHEKRRAGTSSNARTALVRM